MFAEASFKKTSIWIRCTSKENATLSFSALKCSYKHRQVWEATAASDSAVLGKIPVRCLSPPPPPPNILILENWCLDQLYFKADCLVQFFCFEVQLIQMLALKKRETELASDLTHAQAILLRCFFIFSSLQPVRESFIAHTTL